MPGPDADVCAESAVPALMMHGTSLWPAQDRGDRPLLRADLERHGRVHEAPLWLHEVEHVKGLPPHEGTDIRINGTGYRSEGYR